MASFGVPRLSSPTSPPSFVTSMAQAPTPSPLAAPPAASKCSDSNKLLSIKQTMIVAFIMSCILFLGSARKRTSNAFFKICLRATVALTPSFISYFIGQMTTNTYGSNELFWGILLLTGLAGYGTISAFDLRDNETALAASLQGYLKCCFVFGIMLSCHSNAPIPVLLHLLVPLILLRLHYRVESLTSASKTNLSDGVGSMTETIAEFMKWEVQKTLQAEEAAAAAAADPKSMDGYRYLVGIKYLLRKGYSRSPPYYHRNFEKEEGDIVTTQEIWQCEGELLSSRGGDPEGQLKDTCLSFALFWMLLWRYIGYPLDEVTSLEGKSWNFIRYGLMPDISQATSERTFKVIEQELSFLYDYFYTKNFTTYLKGTRFVLLQFLLMVAYLSIAEYILIIHLRPIKVDTIITRIVIYTMFTFEMALMVHYLLITHWSRVEWVCTYVRKQLWKSQSWKDRCLRWAIENMCRYSLSKNIKHWKREIGQYSLLRSHDYFDLTYYFSYCLPLDRPKWGRKKSQSIPFSVNLKNAVLLSLHINGQQLTNGISSLRNHRVEGHFSWACNLETHTHTILTWHIATTFCELSHLNQHPGNLNPGYQLVATSLSKYCAYLVAFAPELLPDQKNTTFKIINSVIWEANRMFKGCSNMEAKYEKMRSMTGVYKDAGNPILKKGIWLGKSLVDRMSSESLWEMLGEFWTELLLYLAPSDDVAAHIEHLASGGELITHLWTLLTHAGILKRD